MKHINWYLIISLAFSIVVPMNAATLPQLKKSFSQSIKNFAVCVKDDQNCDLQKKKVYIAATALIGAIIVVAGGGSIYYFVRKKKLEKEKYKQAEQQQLEEELRREKEEERSQELRRREEERKREKKEQDEIVRKRLQEEKELTETMERLRKQDEETKKLLEENRRQIEEYEKRDMERKQQQLQQQQETLDKELVMTIEMKDANKINKLIEAGANVNQTSYGSTLLINVIENMPLRLDIVQNLVDKGAQLEAKDEKNNTTPLIHAITKWGAGEIALFLIKKGANVNATDTYGNTALTIAKDKARNYPSSYYPQIIDALQKAGATE